MCIWRISGRKMAVFIHLVFYCFIVSPVKSLSVSFSLQEDLPKDTLIGSLLKETDLASQVNESVDNLRFNLFKKEEPIISLFRIDVESSQLFTAKVIDREQQDVCLYKVDCIFNFNIAVSSLASKYFNSINVRVNITDVNDHHPTFETSTIRFNLTESITADRSVYRIEGARDLDRGGNNGVQSYEFRQISPSSQIKDFKLVEEKTVNDGLFLNIFTNISLDHERQSFYVYEILARDGGSPQRTGTLTLSINIIDENDNAPKFQNDYANITVKEDTPPNTPIYKFNAKDDDSGLNGEIIYRFKKFQEQQDIEQLFSIDSKTGTVQVIGNLKYEHGKIYHINIEAADKGTISKYTPARLDVSVKDSGNNAPKIFLNFMLPDLGNNTVSVPEDSFLEKVIALINVEDSDTGANGQVSCRTYSTYFGLQSLNDGYKVIVQHKLDRETIKAHSITVTCADKGTPVLESSINFTVHIADANDNPPRFSKYYYRVNVTENNNKGKEIIKVTATDTDEGPNAEISYYMDPLNDTRFTIDRKSGVVISNRNFDRETSAHYTFNVRASDHGNPQTNTTATVWIDISDVNDNAPNFRKANYVFNVDENQDAGTHVGTVVADDIDFENNGQVTYSMAPEYNISDIPFTVSESGELKTRDKLDREKINRYAFTVIAVDKGTPSLTGSTYVTVQVQDKNDNAPIFIFPSSENHTILIPSTTPAESIIASIQAYDLDDDTNGNGNGKVMYFIDGGNEGGIFYLNHDTGSLHYKKSVIIVQDTVYHLSIRIRDGAGNALESTRGLDVVVRYMNSTTSGLSQIDENSDKYVLILVCVICVTVVVSCALIAVICILKRRGSDDKIKNNGLTYPATRLPSSVLYDAPPSLGNPKTYPVPNQNGKTGSKVSFSLENGNTTFTKKQLLEKMTGCPNGRIDSSKSFEKSSIANKFSETNQNTKPHNSEESQSETSGETIPSDSGHGGSEEDFSSQNNNNNDKRIALQPSYFKNGVYVMQEPHSNTTYLKNNSIDRRFSSLSNKPNSKYSDDSMLTSSMNSLWSDNNHMISRQNSNNIQTLPTIPAWTGYHPNDRLNDSLLFYSKDTTIGSQSAHSRDDDECTTTSGSYTINPDEIDDSFDLRPRDMFV